MADATPVDPAVEAKMMMLRSQLYVAMQTLKGDRLEEFWKLLEEVQAAGGRKKKR
jgi:hypothetical protein